MRLAVLLTAGVRGATSSGSLRVGGFAPRKVELTKAGEIYYDRCVRLLADVDLSAEVVRSVTGKARRARSRSEPSIRQRSICCRRSWPASAANIPTSNIMSGSTNDITRGLENGQINLGFIRPVENIGSLRFFSIAHERYLRAVEKTSADRKSVV